MICSKALIPRYSLSPPRPNLPPPDSPCSTRNSNNSLTCFWGMWSSHSTMAPMLSSGSSDAGLFSHDRVLADTSTCEVHVRSMRCGSKASCISSLSAMTCAYVVSCAAMNELNSARTFFAGSGTLVTKGTSFSFLGAGARSFLGFAVPLLCGFGSWPFSPMPSLRACFSSSRFITWPSMSTRTASAFLRVCSEILAARARFSAPLICFFLFVLTSSQMSFLRSSL
mmetsp:Transcript_86047/g.139528  ORF Transcript_86047/g.139528 Transcript_86047/m.139528 type:complete len:225 (-) Transcript_86047:154-828(-)